MKSASEMLVRTPQRAGKDFDCQWVWILELSSSCHVRPPSKDASAKSLAKFCSKPCSSCWQWILNLLGDENHVPTIMGFSDASAFFRPRSDGPMTSAAPGGQDDNGVGRLWWASLPMFAAVKTYHYETQSSFKGLLRPNFLGGHILFFHIDMIWELQIVSALS